MQHNEKSEVLSQEKDVFMEMHMKTGMQIYIRHADTWEAPVSANLPPQNKKTTHPPRTSFRSLTVDF